MKVTPSIVFEDDIDCHDDCIDCGGQEEKEGGDCLELHVVANDGNDERDAHEIVGGDGV